VVKRNSAFGLTREDTRLQIKRVTRKPNFRRGGKRYQACWQKLFWGAYYHCAWIQKEEIRQKTNKEDGEKKKKKESQRLKTSPPVGYVAGKRVVGKKMPFTTGGK